MQTHESEEEKEYNNLPEETKMIWSSEMVWNGGWRQELAAGNGDAENKVLSLSLYTFLSL